MSGRCTVPKMEFEATPTKTRLVDTNNRSHHSPLLLVTASNYDVSELTWENGQLAMHGHGGVFATSGLETKPATWVRSSNDTLEMFPANSGPETKPSTWVRSSSDTLESIVHQATYHQALGNIPSSNFTTSSSSKWTESSGQILESLKKRIRPDSDQLGRNFGDRIQQERAVPSQSATICRDYDSTMFTIGSFDSSRSLKTSKTKYDDSACHGGSRKTEEDIETRGEIGQSQSRQTRRSRPRAADIHNLSERRRRDRINQKMKALQKLVPNASKTDKASMLDEVIQYLKQLKTHAQFMSSTMINVNPHQLMMMQQQQQQQQQLQMSLLAARMGVGNVFLPFIDPTTSVANVPGPTLARQPQFLVPTMVPLQSHTQTNHQEPTAAQTPMTNLPDPNYYALLAQSMNMDLYNKMMALNYQQQVNQAAAQATSCPSRVSQ